MNTTRQRVIMESQFREPVTYIDYRILYQRFKIVTRLHHNNHGNMLYLRQRGSMEVPHMWLQMLQPPPKKDTQAKMQGWQH